MAKNRFRLQFKFWLDVSKAEELHLAELIDELKQGRVFSQAIRDGLRLIANLWQGKVEVLLALFPWVEDYFFQRFLEQQPSSEYALAEQIARLERLLLEQDAASGQSLAQPVAATNGGPKPMTVTQVAAPAFDDNQATLLPIRKAKSDSQAAQNFLNSAFALQN